MNGKVVPANRDLDNSGGDFTIHLGPGSWQLVITRSGISTTGFVLLSKTLDTITVSAHHEPPPSPQLVKPSIAVQSKGDGSFVVSGSNFLPNTTVHIRVVDAALTNVWFNQTSTPQGTIEFPTGKICKLPGQLFFSANDGRSDSHDLTGTLWSNTVTVSCPL